MRYSARTRRHAEFERSSDEANWPGWLRRYVNKCVDGSFTHCAVSCIPILVGGVHLFGIKIGVIEGYYSRSEIEKMLDEIRASAPEGSKILEDPTFFEAGDITEMSLESSEDNSEPQEKPPVRVIGERPPYLMRKTPSTENLLDFVKERDGFSYKKKCEEPTLNRR